RLYYGNGGGEHTFERAGYPNEISKFAHFSNTPRYYGYYVGGGVLKAGEMLPRDTHNEFQATEGTWGWDYGGLFCRFKPHIVLLFTPYRYQGGGIHSYRIDGPPVKDVGPYVEKIREGPAAIHEIKESKHHEE